jgi:hypothetical protein
MSLHMRSASVRSGSRKTRAGKSSNSKSPKTTSERGLLPDLIASELESKNVLLSKLVQHSDQRDSKSLKAG